MKKIEENFTTEKEVVSKNKDGTTTKTKTTVPMEQQVDIAFIQHNAVSKEVLDYQRQLEKIKD